MKIRINRVVHPITVLGPGRRLGIWVQGCGIRCPGCASVDTWDPLGGELVDTALLAEQLSSVITKDGLDGLALTGGEPTDQGEALAHLVWLLRQQAELDVLLFTGRALKAATRAAPDLVAAVDALVAGPYRRDQNSSHPLLASANQTLTVSAAAKNRYDAWINQHSRRPTQLIVSGNSIQMVGLPHPGDLDRWRRDLSEAGINFEEVSWAG